MVAFITCASRVGLLCLIALAASLLIAFSSSAQSTATVTRYSLTFAHAQFNVSNQTSAQAACAQAVVQFMTYLGPTWGGPVYGPANYTGTAAYAGWDYGSYAAGQSEPAQAFCYLYVKPSGSAWTLYDTASMTATTGPGALPCPSAGETRFINFTLGFTDDPQLSKSATVNTYADKFQALLGAGATCVSGSGSACSATLAVDTASLGKSWISAAPTSQGLYRVSQDYKVAYTGAACTLSADQKMLTESTDAAPACSGVYGTVNGKGVCVPGSTANRNVLTPAGNAPRYAGNPSAGSNAGLPLSSRTPSAGSGANDGGPVSPVDGSPAPVGSPLPTTPSSSGSGGGLQPSDIPAACGAPGQPACKLDEAGTNTAAPDMSLKTTDLNTQASAQRTQIAGDQDKGFFSGWSQFFTIPPLVQCQPLALPKFMYWDMPSIDVCQVIVPVREVMGWIWAFVAFWVCLGWIREVV